MGNLKHTIVSIIAVVMISSLAVAQASEMTTSKNSNIKGSAPVNVINVDSSKVWYKSLPLKATDIKDVNNSKEIDNIDDKNDSSDEQTQDNAEQNVMYVLVTEGALNVREASNTECEVVDQLSCAEKVSVLGEEGEWYQVSYGMENKIGYVTKASLTASFDEAKAVAVQTTSYEKGVAVVGDGALNIRSNAGTEFSVVDQIDNGDTVIVLAKEGDWLQVYYGRNYNVGYVIADSVNINGVVSRDEVSKKQKERLIASAISKGVVTISSGAVNVRESADEGASVKDQLSNKTNVLVLSRANGWTKILYGADNTSVGYVKSEYIVDPAVQTSRSSMSKSNTTAKAAEKSTAKNTATSTKKAAASTAKTEKSTAKSTSSNLSKGQSLVAEAEKYIGTKYVYGGSSTSGFDCSGLVQYVCRKQGISVGRSSRDQINNGVSVSRSDLQPGDLVFFKRGGTISHVGIYAGNGQMIHSPQTGKTVCYTSIESSSRKASYAGARRITGN